MAILQTTLGPMALSDIRMMLSHEHVFTDFQLHLEMAARGV